MIAKAIDDFRCREPEHIHDAAGLLAAGHSTELVASLCYLPIETVETMEIGGRAAEYVPLPDEIKTKAAEIRAGWTAAERASRTFSGRDEWLIPGIAGDLRIEADESQREAGF